MYRIPVYAPNISKERLGELVQAQLADVIPGLTVARPARPVAFRAPELDVIVPSDRLEHLLPVFGVLLAVGRGLGASQFQIKHSGFEMRPRSTAVAADELERLLIACLGFVLEQVEMY
ncbi:MAG: hypothetical protein SH809_01145 [Rhodothermales bacterium]|nr:hypothetical protein [Rhodothermales bacterium]